ncbi:hypothetical protein L1987_09327 [Smallanthus sonchifolius]|uniref:Uncharacterized protein n=1 Tax=Smallanthus sonchifolius TaxID=185202 RepID=A0ACB9JPD3_9ASTR|nr:hypothetical protein L1987_09327 [Smallanthus sonchifolius]
MLYSIQEAGTLKFRMYPRFLQHIFDTNIPNLIHDSPTLVPSHLTDKVFANMSCEHVDESSKDGDTNEGDGYDTQDIADGASPHSERSPNDAEIPV